MKRIFIYSLLVLFTACSKNPHAEVSSASIETQIKRDNGSIGEIVDVYQSASITLIVYDFGDMPQVNDPKNSEQVAQWFAKHARCYQNNQELELSGCSGPESFVKHDKLTDRYDILSFIKGKQCGIYLNYKIPDDNKFADLRFDFALEGLKIVYVGDFKNNKYRYTNGTFNINNCSRNSLELTPEKDIRLHSLSLVAGEKRVNVKSISLKYAGTMRLENGAEAGKGSSVSLDNSDVFLTKGYTLECAFEPDDSFIPEKVELVTEKGSKPFYYDFTTNRWEE